MLVRIGRTATAKAVMREQEALFKIGCSLLKILDFQS